MPIFGYLQRCGMDGHPVVIGQSDENILTRRFKNVLKGTDASFLATDGAGT